MSSFLVKQNIFFLIQICRQIIIRLRAKKTGANTHIPTKSFKKPGIPDLILWSLEDHNSISHANGVQVKSSMSHRRKFLHFAFTDDYHGTLLRLLEGEVKRLYG